MNKKLTLLIFGIVLNTCLVGQKTIYCNQIGYFNHGVAPVLVDNKWGFIDKTGSFVIEPKYVAWVEDYGALPAFSEGLTPFVDQSNERIGYLNLRGEVVIPPKFYSARPFKESVAFVGGQNDYVLIDTTGKVIAANFVAINGYYSNFSNNRAVVQKQFQMGYIDKSGRFVVPAEFDQAKDFAEGFAAVNKDGKWGFINSSGQLTVPFNFNKEPKSFSDYRAFVQGTNNKWGIIDTLGKIIVAPQYHQVWPFSGGVAVVSTMDERWNETFHFIDVNGKIIKTHARATNMSETITFSSGFVDGLAIGSKANKKGFVDKNGRVVVDFQYRDLHPLQDGMAWFEKFDEKTREVSKGFLGRAGNVILIIEPPMF